LYSQKRDDHANKFDKLLFDYIGITAGCSIVSKNSRLFYLQTIQLMDWTIGSQCAEMFHVKSEQNW